MKFLLALSTPLWAQSCTGLCLQQVSCPGGGTTSVSGVVYAPNGTDPLPHIQVYIPNAPVPAFAPGVSCPIANAVPSGSPLVGTISAVDGQFTLNNVPVGQNIPLVIVSGRWRRQLVIPSTTACTNTALPHKLVVMPQNRSQGDIPKIAIATGAEDVVECAMIFVGIDPAEITDASGGGRINLYAGGGAPGSGAVVDEATPTQASLMNNPATLNQYDVLMLPSEDAESTKPAAELTNLVDYANAGGRVFTSHYSYTWMINNPPFDTVANWSPGYAFAFGPAEGTVDTDFPEGQTLAAWLELTTGSQYIVLPHAFVDTQGNDGVLPPTQEWVSGTFPKTPMGPSGTATAQFVFDTPIAPSGSGVNQCGRVLYDDYDVVSPPAPVTGSTVYPKECPDQALTGATSQEKLLEFNLFELSDTGGLPTLSPSTFDFGSQAVGYATAPAVFTWTNNSTAPATVSSATVTGTDFTVIAGTDTCTNSVIAGGASCTVSIHFMPSVIGTRAGTLSVLSGGFSVVALLTGTGTPTFTLTPSSLNFGGVAAGGSASLPVTLTSTATTPIPLPTLQTTAGYTVSTAGCPNPVPAMGTCVATVTFSPTTISTQSGVESGTLTAETAPVNQRTLLYGYGIPALTLTPANLDFGSQAIDSSTTETLTLKSFVNQPLATPVFAVTGSFYTVDTTPCGAQVKALSTCQVGVTFAPQTAGVFPGTLADNSTNLEYAGLNVSLTGTAGDFSLAFNPDSGSVIAGEGTTANVVITELKGHDPSLMLTCTLVATAAKCSISPGSSTATTLNEVVNINTTSEYLVIGYTGFGGRGGFWLIAVGSGCLIWLSRRRARAVLRGVLAVVLLAVVGLSLTACSGLLPAKNASFTAPGNYVVTVTATEGLLVHSATYNLTVNAK